MRPLSPEPLTFERSIPCSSAACCARTETLLASGFSSVISLLTAEWCFEFREHNVNRCCRLIRPACNQRGRARIVGINDRDKRCVVRLRVVVKEHRVVLGDPEYRPAYSQVA